MLKVIEENENGKSDSGVVSYRLSSFARLNENISVKFL